MPSLIDIRRRIRSVKSTQQITKAMKLVSASKLRRAQEHMQNARPFARQMLRVLNSLATRVDPASHPLLQLRDDRRPGARILLVVITADRGLCGSFNTNVIKAAATFIVDSPGREIALGLIGRKGRDYFTRRGFDVRYERVNVFAHLHYADAQRIAQVAVEEFGGGEIDAVYLLYNEFKSILQQRIAIERLLPIPRLEGLDRRRGGGPGRLPLRTRAPADLRRPAAAPRRGAGVPRAARIGGGRAGGAHGGDGHRHEEFGGDDRPADALHEQGAAGGNHARDHRSGVRGASLVTLAGPGRRAFRPAKARGQRLQAIES